MNMEDFIKPVKEEQDFRYVPRSPAVGAVLTIMNTELDTSMTLGQEGNIWQPVTVNPPA